MQNLRQFQLVLRLAVSEISAGLDLVETAAPHLRILTRDHISAGAQASLVTHLPEP